ncbi:glycosyltransferase family 9 protein [Nocardioides sp. KC13]|uniref:Glycosyltransferase family 9 protein n=1 Tax=Nocardioides turkmenicus TaxID=2711220 RepID=A0A6M1R4E5_9ACTN|nr:glycosyltransferase family 9 protein [Nocardioides sp. KC13]NGN91367.1 glycosyltransferase family 9 protein [Nocardioides sp. KC13]
MRTALVYRALGLGDLLTGVPALRMLRRALPRHRIVLAAPAAQTRLITLAAIADQVIATEELDPVAWTGPPPDVAIDLHGNGPASRDLLRVLGPRRLIGFDEPGGPAWDPAEHERHRWCRLLAETLGGDPEPDDVRIPPPDPEPPPVPDAILVHPGAASGSRRWPADRFAAVATRMTLTGAPVLVTGSPAERDLAEDVRSRAGLPPEANLAGETDLMALASLVSAARLIVCGDTGIAHLASALGTPSVVLLGPTPPSTWGPPPGPHIALWHGDRPGDPHASVPDPALLRLSVDEVSDAALRLLSARHRPPRATAPSA